jgi:homoserine dehydrogenase
VLSILAQRDRPDRPAAFRITTVLVRDAGADAGLARGCTLPAGARYTEDWRECVDPTAVDMVVELIGGTSLAKDIVCTALRRGLHVVTANKALLAAHMGELEEILEAAPRARLCYEAAVGGGIPVIRALQTSVVSSDKVQSLAGILNGTTNYMLSKMAAEACSYGDVLREAQALGFAEADPTADVEGHDARAKISVLARLALGARIPQEDIPCQGITRLTTDDFDYARTLKSTIKLVATARVVAAAAAAAGGASASVQAFVTPCVCPSAGIVANVNGATNVVQIQSASLGTSHLLGAGAGRFPTANSVVADMMALKTGTATAKAFPIACDESLTFDRDYTARFYVRLNVCDQTGIIMSAGAICQKHGISIHAVLQNPITDPTNVPFVMTTDACRRSQMRSFCDDAAKEVWCLERPLVMPLMD